MTHESLLECPYCRGAVPADATICPSCQEDLAALIKLRNAHVIHYNEALTLARGGQLEAAQDRTELALAANPEFMQAHMLLAKLQARQSRWPEAQASIDRARELAPDDAVLIELAVAIADGAQAAARAQAASHTAATHEQAVDGQDDDEAQAAQEPAVEAHCESQTTSQAHSQQLTPRAIAEQQLGIYERDVARAFGLGAAAMGGLALLWRLFGGRSRD